jgi:hypothetical protein
MTLRDEYARTAAVYAYRIEKARGSSEARSMARWTAEYRRATATCRRLGEIIRERRQAV